MVYFDKHLYKKPAWLPLLAASFLLLASAEASPLRVTGDFSTTYEKDSYSDQPTISGLTNTLRLMFEKDLSSNWSAYTRLDWEYTSQPALADFNTANDAYGPERQAVTALDQFGLIYRTPNLTCKIGRQEASIGKTELLYSRPATYIGRTYFVDGVTAAASAGKWEFDFIAAREDNPGRQTNKLYALRTGYHPARSGRKLRLHPGAIPVQRRQPHPSLGCRRRLATGQKHALRRIHPGQRRFRQ